MAAQPLGEQRMLPTRDGRSMRALVAGDGSDLVVLEAGLGSGADAWARVVPLLAGAVTVVAYDRAGYGGSDPASDPRELAHLADDLGAVLDAVAHQRAVLVGHSWGGPIVRTLAARRAADGRLAGIVLVDQSDEHAALYFSPLVRAQAAVQRALYEPLARMRLLAPLVRATLRELPEPHRSGAVAATSTLTAARAMRAEDAQVTAELARLRERPLELGELPVRVLSGRRAGRLDRSIRDAMTAAHRATVATLPGGRLVEATRSGHLVPITEPELVAAEALDLLR
ncbi:alpha/beta fold hydrolase [Agrococcus baldri]|uniref:Hydrolase or acyltransferase of alpha/beta superfamily protein n=1 Tax=Agrococcus baldri TaxID=153730 RepID=A0AA87RL93_9MICO|nr:alpha/beta hydrolase [Agrococcus baldri]GEK81123.1 hydrolase or acyltransferase of alpha/beta superfamily protein [Agrococcus baldri]